MRDSRAYRDATIAASRFLRENGYTHWLQGPGISSPGDAWRAVIHLRNGEVVEKSAVAE